MGRLKKGEREQERLFPLADAASKCSAVGPKGPRVIIDPPSVPDSPCPGARGPSPSLQHNKHQGSP